MNLSRMVINLVLFQTAWLACVPGAANGQPRYGYAAVIVAYGVHIGLHDRPLRQVWLIPMIAIVGSIADLLLAGAGLVSFPRGAAFLGPLPLWMPLLWVAFATTLTGCLRFLQDSFSTAGAFGFFAGPIAYLAADQFGAVRIDRSYLAYAAIAIAWCVAVAAAAHIANRDMPFDHLRRDGGEAGDTESAPEQRP